MGPTLFLILAVVVGTQAGPIDTISRDTQTCARTCTGTNKFNYEQDKTYEFEYISKTSTSMVGASEGQADLEVTATAHVEVISKCELVLRVDNVRLFDTDPVTGAKRDSQQTRQFQRALEAHPLRFSFQDGEIEEVCPASGEQTWVLNIKRGMLSMFQNSMDDFSRDQNVKEHDVTGSCDAEYTVGENGWYTRSIRKTKNLLGCTGRHGYNTAIQGTPYRVPSKIQSLPIVKSTHECQQDISKEGRLQGASCTESHVFRPFSRESSGAVTKNIQNLKFLRERNGVSSPPMVSQRAKLMFEHANDLANMERSRTDTESKLREICQSTSTDIRPDTPKLFSDLVYLMKSLDAVSMKEVYQLVKSTTFCSENQNRLRKFFLDAIPMVGTSSSLRLLTELITSNEVNGIEADMWMTSLAFIQNPTKDMLKEIVPLLSQAKGMLSVGTLVHSYCRVAPCDNDNDVRSIISELESKIGYGCYVDDSNMKQIIIALRSIGNAGQAESATSTINSCLARNENPTEVVLAAIDAFRRLSCDADRSSILAIFNDKTKDSELRIGAYIALMECPSTSFLSRVKQTLETEEANQVGSFIWTHLTNLMETSIRHKQNIRAILEDETLQREFDMDKRKFSRNYEGSFFLEKLNTGASLEGNLIWSSKSFIPRSAMANLTVDLFGQSINLFEIGGRIEGLEYFLESYFGPNGYFSEDNVKEATEQSVKGISSKKFKNIDTRFKSSMDEMRGNLYMRVFGNELRYNSFNGVKDLFNSNDFNFLDFLIKLSKNHDYSFTQNIMFLDSSMIIPTSSGFPLNLTVNGTATIDLKASGRMDLRKLGTSPRSVSINGVIQPSGSILISSMMSVDAFVTKSGMKMVSTLHSSTALQGNIELVNGRVFNAQLDMPRQKMEILNFKTSFFTVHHDTEREQQMITENRQTKTVCTGDKMAKITGLEFCGEVQFPNASLKADAPYFPLTGPVSLTLDMYKRDSHTSYQMEAKLVNTKEEATMRLAFNTPGSTVDRALAVDFILRKEGKTLEMNMISPWKKTTFTGKVQYDRNVKHLSGKIDVDGKTLYSVKSEIKRSRKGPSYIYTPVVEIRVPRTKVIKLGGSAEYQPGKLLDASLTLAGITKQPIKSSFTMLNKKIMRSVKASVSLEKGKVYSFESRLQTYITKKAIKYRPFLSVKTPLKELIAFGGSVEYRSGSSATVDLTLDKVVDKPIKIFGKVRLTGNAKRQRVQGKIDIRSPILTTKMQSNIAIRGGKALNVRTQMDYAIPKVIRDKVTLTAKIIRSQTKTTTTIKSNTNVGFKRNSEYNFQVAGSMSHNKKHSEGMLEVTYGANKKDTTKRIFVSTSLTPKLAWKTSNLKFDTQIQHPASGIDMHVRLGHKHDRKSVDSSIIFEYGKKKSVSTSLRLKNKSKALTSMTGSLSLAYPGKEIVISNDLTENNKNDFTNEISIQTAKNRRSTMTTNLRRPSKTEYEISTNIQIVDMDRVSLGGQINIDPKNFRVQLEKGNDRYAVRSATQYTENEGLTFNGDLQYPSRRITAEIEGRKKNPVYTGRIDIKWNADRNEKERLQLNLKAMCQGIDNIESSVSLTYPTNTLTLNLKHVGGKKYASHVDMRWDTSKVIVLDTTFGIKEAKNSKQVKGTIKMSSPFRGFRSIAIDTTTQIDSSRYTTSMNINWKPIKKISATVTLKKPISWDALDASIVVKSPLKGYQRSSLEISHAVGKKMASKAKLNWNKNFMQVSVEGTDKSSPKGTDVLGRVSIKSTINSVKAVTLSFGHKSSGKKFQNNLKLRHNNDVYSYEGEMMNALRGFRLNNNGRFIVTLPENQYESSWTHKNTESDIVSNMNIKWGQNTLEIGLNGAQDLTWSRGTMSSSLIIRSPFEAIRNFGLNLNHEHRRGMISSTFNVNKNGNVLTRIESSYNRENNVAKTSHVLQTNNKEMSLKSTTQYGTYPMTTDVALQWSPNEKIQVVGSLDKTAQSLINGHLKFSSPFTYDKMLSLNQNQDGEDTLSTASIRYEPDRTISMESRYKWDNTKKIYFTLNTPYQSLRQLQTEMEFTGNMQAFRSIGSLEIQPSLRKVSISSHWSTIRGVSGNVRIDTPFAQLPYAQGNIESKLKGKNRQTSISIEYSPSKTLSIETVGRLEPYDIEGVIRITTPFSEMPYTAATFRHQGGLQRFQTHCDYECPRSGKYEMDINFNNQANKEGSIIVKLPSSDDISARFSHSGDRSNFQSHGELSYEAGKLYEADIKFVHARRSEGSIILKSPIADNIIGSFRHSGDLSNFQSHAEFQFARGRKYESDVVFRNGKKSEGSITFKQPDYDDIKAAVSHRGRISNFKSHAEFTYKKGETYEGDLVLNVDRNINSKLTISTPVNGYRKLKASFVHKGSWKSFNCRANIANGKRNIEGNIRFNLKPTITAEATIETPYRGYRNLRAALSHEGSRRNFKCHGELSNGNSNKIIGDLEVAVDPSMKFVASLMSPFKGFESMRTTMTHEAAPNSYKTYADISYLDHNPIIVNAKLDTSSQMSAEVSIQTPFTGYEQMSGTINYSGSIDNFASSAEIANGENKISGDARFSKLGPITGEITVTTPFRGLKVNRVAFSHDGTRHNFISHGEILFNNKKSESDVTFSSMDNTEGNLVIKSPYFEHIKGSFSVQGKISNLRSQANIMYGKTNIVDGMLTFATAPTTRGSFTLQALQKPRIQGTFTHEGQRSNFHTQAEMSFGRQRIELDTAVNIVDDLSGNIVLKVPYIEDIQAAISHTARRSGFRSHIEGAIGVQKVESDVTFSSKSGISITANLKTPFHKYNEMEVSLSHSGKINNFKSHAEYIHNGRKSEVNAFFNSNGRISGGAVLKTPVYNDIAVQFNHEGPLHQFTTHGEITYAGERQITGDISMQSQPSIEFATTIKTPVDMIRFVQVTAKHEGSLANFRSEAEITRNSEKASFVASFDSTADIVAKASLRLPELNEIAISGSHSGVPRNFHSHAEIIFGGSKQYEMDASLNTADLRLIDGSVNVKTPLDKFDNVLITLHHRNNAESLSTTGSVEGIASKKIEIAMNLEKGQRKDLTFTLSSPFSRDIRLVLSHEGRFPNSRLSADAFYDSQEKLHVEADLDKGARTTGSLLMRVAGNTVNAMFNHRGDLQNLNNHVEITVNGQKMESDILFSSTDKTIGSLSIKSPIRHIEDVRASFNHKSTKSNTVSHVELGYKDQNIVGDVSFKAGRKAEVSIQTPFSKFENNRVAIIYTPSSQGRTAHAELFALGQLYQSDVILNTDESSLTVQTPIRGYESTKVLLNHNFGENRIQTHAELVYGNGQKIESDLILRLESPFEGTFILKTPFAGIESTKAAFNYEFVNSRMQTHGEFVYGNQQRIESDIVLRVESPFEGSFTLRTPFLGFEEITSSFTHQFSESSLQTHAEVNYAPQKKIETDISFGSNDRMEGSISLKTPFRNLEELSASFRHSDTQSHGEVSYGPQKKIEADLSYTAEPQLEGSIMIKTPFRGMEQTSASARHHMTNDNMESHAEIIFATKKFEADINASKYPLQGRMTVKTPYADFRETSFAVQNEMSDDSLRNHLEFVYGQGAKVESEITVSKDPLRGSLVLKTPFSGFEDVTYLLQQEKTSDMFKLHSELIYGQDKIEGELELTKSPLSGTLTLKTPFPGMTETVLLISHDQKRSSFKSHAELVYGQQQKLEADISLDNGRQQEGRITIKTPFSGFEETSASFQHFYIATNLKSSAEVNYGNGEKVEVDILFNNQDQIEGKFAVKTPFAGYRETVALFRHNPTSGNIQSHAEISLEGQKSEADLEIENRLDTLGITTSVQSPLYDTMGLHFSKNGPLDNMVLKGETTMANRKPVMLMVKNVKIGSKIESSLTFQNPYTEEIAARFDHNGGWRRFRSTVEASMGNQKRLHGELVLRSRSNFVNIGSSLEISFDDSQYTTGFDMKHDGDINNFKSSAVATYQGQKVDLKTQFKNAGTVEGSFTLKTPISSLSNVGASFQHSGSINQFSSSGNVQYAPGKLIEAKAEFFKYGWRRISTSMELKTPFNDYRFTKLTYKHRGDSDSIQCNGDLTYGSGKQLIGSLKSSLSPLEFAVAARTPFKGFEDISAGAKYEEQGERYVSEANVVYNTGKKIEIKSVVDMQTNPITVNAKVTTPFAGFESSELTLTKSGTLRNFRTTGEFQASYASPFRGEVTLRYDNLSEMEGLVTFTSQFDNFENLRFNLRNSKTGDECHSHMECSWTATNAIVTDTVFGVTEKWNGKSVVYGFTMSTPFDSMNTVIVKGNIELTDKYADHMYIEHNGETILDIDMEYTKENKHSAIVTMREPRAMILSTNGIYTDSQKGGDITFNWDTKTSDSNVRIEGMMNDKNDYYTSKKDISLKASTSDRSVGLNGVYEKSNYRTMSSADLFVDAERKVGYEMESTSNRDDQKSCSLKLRLPTRTLAFTNSYEPNSANGAFLWDADRDETKKITITGRLVPKQDGKKVDISFSMPSIGKDVHLDSEMTLNDGRVIFDGKTEFRYSDDSRKKLVIHSKLEDISSGYSKNYSLSFGVSHPYTNVDIQMESHIGKSDEKYTAGMDVLYLTAQRQRKNFALMGEIDSYRNEINVQVISPVKSIRLQGTVKTQAPYKVSVQNVYGEVPMNAQATFNPERRSMDFSMNYDLDNPRKMFHVSAKYVNSTAILAEMFREENGQRVTDSLFAVRLNTTRIMHTRLHWRPTMLQDLKEYGLNRIHRYGTKMDATLSEVGEAISEELNYKYNIIKQAGSEDFQPFADFITETMAEFGGNIQAARRELNRMYQTNEYYTQDIYVYYDRMLQDIQTKYNTKMQQVREWSEGLKSAASSWTYFPLKGTYDRYLLTLREILQEGEQTSSLLYRQLLETIEDKLIMMSRSLEEKYNYYQQQINETVVSVSSHPHVQLVQDKYTQYLNKIQKFQIPQQAKSMAQKYSSAIYNAREQISAGLNSIMNRKDIKHLQSIANEAYYQGAAAYKYWEVEENVKSIFNAIVEYIREDIEEELTSITDTLLNLQKSTVTVYDLENGEIQTDTYLPISVTSLDTVPSVNVVKYVKRVKSYIPDSSRWSASQYIPDSDSYMLPPFKGIARVSGDHITTFDGEEYDMSGRCSYILARDYTDGNFTIMMDYLGRQKRKLVVYTATQSIQVSPTSKVKVDGLLTSLPYKSSEVEIKQEGDIIKINGRGFSVVSDIPRDTYDISVSGFYFGKTGGLLGTLNNERHDDMMMSNKRTTTDVNALVESWEVDSNCR